jgi:hypothetical protein
MKIKAIGAVSAIGCEPTNPDHTKRVKGAK